VVESAWSVTTGDGSIRLEVPEGFSADLDAQSADGRVRVEKRTGQAPVSAERDESERGSARGTLGAGGKPLKLRSGSGSITVKSR